MSTRTSIRSAIVTLCEGIDGIATVYAGRRRTIPETALPAICVYVEGEEKQLSSISTPRVYERQLTVTCEIHAQGNSPDAVEAALDGYCSDREDALLADETLGGLAIRTTLSSDEYEVDEDARRPAAVAICRDVILYRA